MEQVFDVIVIGSGPGGYPAAIKAAQMGKKTALIEAYELGGTCLNRGCIPSKTLISSAHILHQVQRAKDFGISVDGGVSIDYGKMVDRKDSVVTGIRNSLGGLLKSNGITIVRGRAEFTGPKTLKVTGQDSGIFQAKSIIVATGSEPRSIGAFPFDGKKILDSTALLELRKLPKSLIIVGGGVIGCEFASLFSAFDVKVTVLEMMPRLLPMEAENVSAALAAAFKEKKIAVETGVKVEALEVGKKGVTAKLGGGKSIEADLALVAVGRKLNTEKIGLEKAGVALTEAGLVAVNDRMETSVSGVYAIGDIASKWWLAHVATHQGVVAATNAAGGDAQMHYNAVPSVIFTDPEIATVGLSLEAAKAEGFDAKAGAFPFQALGKSQATRETEGFSQIIIDKKTGQILGAQVVGSGASALIAHMALAITNELTVESVIETIHAHPTIAEGWLEAALVANETPIHLPPKKKR